MIRFIVLTLSLLLSHQLLFSQKGKPVPEFMNIPPGEISISTTSKLKKRSTAAVSSFDVQSLQQLKIDASNSLLNQKRNSKGEIIAINIPKLNNENASEANAYELLIKNSLPLAKRNEGFDYSFISTSESVTGSHFRFQQNYNGVPIEGLQCIVHFGSAKSYINGRINTDLNIPAQTETGISRDNAISTVEKLFEKEEEWQDLNSTASKYFGSTERVEAHLVYVLEKSELKLAWKVAVHNTVTTKWELFINAITGKEISRRPAYCQFMAEGQEHHCHNECHNEKNSERSHSANRTTIAYPIASPLGPETAIATDLLGQPRTINVYQEGGTYYLIDASRSMFNASNSSIPNDPYGVIHTVNANNTYPNSNFNASHISSSNNDWTNANAVSAHYNGGRAYEYFKEVHGRNSINGSGGNIISIINVSDENGQDFDNAFWNGAAMFYGNGNQLFSYPLARGLDVAGHEMSHGVIQATANLTYQNQSGALNESFADIFGAMIDRNDWNIGEDVVNPSVFPSGTMRSMSNPNNGGNSSNFYWQPKHMDEFQNLPNTQSGDWGGVHKNSGIPNHAYYLFAESVGKEQAESVYYEVLDNHLVAASEFVDLRIAVVEVASQLFGPNTQAAAESAFDQVGIMSGPGNDFQNDDMLNPGEAWVLVADLQNIALQNPNTQALTTISIASQKSRPSITDDGSYMVFVDGQNRIKQLTIDWNTGDFNESFLENNPQTIWRNVAVSKDGTKLALLTTEQNNELLIFDGASQTLETFVLNNPTTLQGVNTGDVAYADALEWDITGEYVMYDAFNQLESTFLEDISYWDIGIVKVWDNDSNNFAEGHILKLFNGLQENESVGNPTFSKNSPYIISFDYITTDFFDQASYSVLGSNVQSGEIGTIFSNSKLGYPSYHPNDEQVLFSASTTSGDDVIGVIGLNQEKITGVGEPSILVDVPRWAVWFANGERVLVNNSDLAENKDFIIFPNPTNGMLFLENNELKSGPYLVSIFDVSGRLMLSQENQIQDRGGKIAIDTKDLQNGSYFIRLENENGEISHKTFIFQR